VEVKGTCFRVEVEMKKQMVLSASAGAAMAATVLVSVYEGRVLLANEHGRTELVAGQQAVASSESAPSRPTEVTHAALSDGKNGELTREELLVRDRAQREQMAKLEAKVKELEAHAQSPEVASRDTEKEKPFLNPSKEDLLDMAKKCQLRWDSPPDGNKPWNLSPSKAADLGLQEGERSIFNQFNSEYAARHLKRVREFFIQAGGDAKLAESLSPWTMHNEIEDMLPADEIQKAYWRLAQERAGLLAAQTDPGNLADRFVRYTAMSGDTYEQELGAVLGPDLAHAMRTQLGGWPSRSTSSHGCPNE
jgi:hypothetical protein